MDDVWMGVKAWYKHAYDTLSHAVHVNKVKCVREKVSCEVFCPHWIAVNVDTGAGGTVWPMNADYAFEKVAGPEGRKYKTAVREMVERTRTLPGAMPERWGGGGHRMHMTGEKASIHEPLLSARDVTDKDARWLDGDVGCSIQKKSPTHVH